jgi:hypothetical protein
LLVTSTLHQSFVRESIQRSTLAASRLSSQVLAGLWLFNRK